MIRVYDDAGNAIETHEHAGDLDATTGKIIVVNIETPTDEKNEAAEHKVKKMALTFRSPIETIAVHSQ